MNCAHGKVLAKRHLPWTECVRPWWWRLWLTFRRHAKNEHRHCRAHVIGCVGCDLRIEEP